jgi:hypothetical protein
VTGIVARLSDTCFSIPHITHACLQFLVMWDKQVLITIRHSNQKKIQIQQSKKCTEKKKENVDVIDENQSIQKG